MLYCKIIRIVVKFSILFYFNSSICVLKTNYELNLHWLIIVFQITSWVKLNEMFDGTLWWHTKPILYIKATAVSVCLCVFYLSLTSFDSWPLFLWYPFSSSFSQFFFQSVHSFFFSNVLGGGGRESPVKHGAGGGPAGGASRNGGGHGWGRTEQRETWRVHYAPGSH
jgi:hypothetical protein